MKTYSMFLSAFYSILGLVETQTTLLTYPTEMYHKLSDKDFWRGDGAKGNHSSLTHNYLPGKAA